MTIKHPISWEEIQANLPAQTKSLVSIGDLSKATGLPNSLIREWETKGKMPQAIRPGGEAGHRFFTVDSLRTWIEQLNEGEIKNR
jgi:hypothetical protein